MEIKNYKPVGFSEDKKPTPRMLFNSLFEEAIKRKANGDEVTYQDIMAGLTPPKDPNDVWGDAIDLTEGKPKIPQEKLEKMFAAYCTAEQE